MEVRGDARAGDRAEVQADVEPVGAARLAQRGDGALGEAGQLGGLRLVQLGVVRDVPVRAHHEVTGVVRVEVQDGEDALPAPDDQAVLVAHLRNLAERASVVRSGAGGLALTLDVGHPVRCPQPLELVGIPDSVLFLMVGLGHASSIGPSPHRAVFGCRTSARFPRAAARLTRMDLDEAVRLWDAEPGG